MALCIDHLSLLSTERRGYSNVLFINRLLARVSSLIYSDSTDGNDDHEQLEEVTSLSRKHRVEARAKWGVGWQEGNEDKHRAGGN